MYGRIKDLYKGLLILMVILVIVAVVFGGNECTFHLKDSETGEYVPDPNINPISGLTQVAAPGTGGSGAMIYKISIPRIAQVTAKTYGYEEKSLSLFLYPGKSIDILLDKK